MNQETRFEQPDKNLPGDIYNLSDIYYFYSMKELSTLDVESVRCYFPYWKYEKAKLLSDFEILVLLHKYLNSKN